MNPTQTDIVNPTLSLDPATGLTETLRTASARHGERAILLCSFQKEESVILDELLRVSEETGAPLRVVTIDTGVLFEETMSTWRAFEERFGVRIDVQDATSTNGPWTGPENCCGDAKVAALERALEGAEAWITGVRREQSETRANAGRADRTRLRPRHLEVQPARPLDRQGPVAAHNRARPAVQPASRSWLRVDRLRHVHAAGQRARRALGGHREDRVRPARGSGGRMSTATRPQLTHLRALESEAIHVMREVAAEFERPVLLFSGGKDSIVLLRLAEKAFRPGRFPFPIMHVDTGHNFPEVIEFRDQLVAELGERLIVASVQESIDKGRVVEEKGPRASRNQLQTVTLLDAIAEHGFDAAFGGARRDEERARAKERVLSFRDDFGQWDPKNQRPELWNLYNGRIHKGEHARVFPISNWTELDVWEYIDSEQLAVPSIYFAHERKVFNRDGMLYAWHDDAELMDGETVFTETVRYRTVGDMSCTGGVRSQAQTLEDVVVEIASTRVTERGETRADDKVSEAAMEDRKKAGYF